MAETRTLEREVLEGKVVTELQEIASRLGVSGTQRLKKSDLISAILKATPDGKADGKADTKDGAKADGKPPREPRAAEAADPPPAADSPSEAEAPATVEVSS